LFSLLMNQENKNIKALGKSGFSACFATFRNNGM